MAQTNCMENSKRKKRNKKDFSKKEWIWDGTVEWIFNKKFNGVFFLPFKMLKDVPVPDP